MQKIFQKLWQLTNSPVWHMCKQVTTLVLGSILVHYANIQSPSPFYVYVYDGTEFQKDQLSFQVHGKLHIGQLPRVENLMATRHVTTSHLYFGQNGRREQSAIIKHLEANLQSIRSEIKRFTMAFALSSSTQRVQEVSRVASSLGRSSFTGSRTALAPVIKFRQSARQITPQALFTRNKEDKVRPRHLAADHGNHHWLKYHQSWREPVFNVLSYLSVKKSLIGAEAP